MFSFGEILLIALVGLLVIGPRRLPETVRFVALQAGRLRQSMTETRKMVEDELGMDDIRRQLHNEQVMRSLNATREQIERAAKGLPPAAKPGKKPGKESDAEVQVDAGAGSDQIAEDPADAAGAHHTPAVGDVDTPTPAPAGENDAADGTPPPHNLTSLDNKTP